MIFFLLNEDGPRNQYDNSFHVCIKKKKRIKTSQRIETSVTDSLWRLFLSIGAHCPRMVEYFLMVGPLFSILFVLKSLSSTVDIILKIFTFLRYDNLRSASHKVWRWQTNYLTGSHSSVAERLTCTLSHQEVGGSIPPVSITFSAFFFFLPSFFHLLHTLHYFLEIYWILLNSLWKIIIWFYWFKHESDHQNIVAPWLVLPARYTSATRTQEPDAASKEWLLIEKSPKTQGELQE